MSDVISLEELSSYEVTVDNVKYTLFDLSSSSFKNVRTSLYQYIVGIEDEMRLDLICNNIYGSNQDEDVIMFINDIKNQFKIKKDTVILYPLIDYVDSFRDRVDKGSQIRTVVSDNRNKKRIDTKRMLYKQNLPPSMTISDYNPISVVDGKLVIGKGILEV